VGQQVSFPTFRTIVGHFFSFASYLCFVNTLNKDLMAGKIVSMSKIKQVLQLYDSRHYNREIARLIGLNKDTVNKYVNTFIESNKSLDELLKLEDPELEKMFNSGTPAYTDTRHKDFLNELPYLKKEIQRPHVTKHLLWEEYINKYPEGYRKSQFYYHLKQNTNAAKPTTVLTGTYIPGEKLFVDFTGDTMSYTDLDTGDTIRVQVFVASMPFSDYLFTICVPSQKVEDFLYAISKCFEFLGGVPKILVPDNLKSAVIRADRYEPTLNKALEDMGNYYHFVVIPCQPYSPTQKALVEDGVKITYNRIMAKLRNRTFYSLNEINQAFREKTLELNQTRMQRHDYSREERYVATEKEKLGPLPLRPYEMKYHRELLVHQDGFISLACDNHYYSVPYTLIGKKAKIVYTRSLVKIYIDGDLVASHERVKGFGYSKKDEHLAPNSLAILNRSPELYIKKSTAVSNEFGELITTIFSVCKKQKMVPEFYYKTCALLFHLHRISKDDDFNAACKIALDNKIYKGSFFKSILSNIKEAKVLNDKKEHQNPLPSNHENMRGNEYYL